MDADEINDIVVGLFRLGGIEEDQDLLAACVFDVLEAVDQEGDGDPEAFREDETETGKGGDGGTLSQGDFAAARFQNFILRFTVLF